MKSKKHYPLEGNISHGYFINVTYKNDSNGVYITGSVDPSYVTVSTGSTTTLGYRKLTIEDVTGRIVWAEAESFASGSNLSGSIRVLGVNPTLGVVELQEQVSNATDRRIYSHTGSVLVYASEDN